MKIAVRVKQATERVSQATGLDTISDKFAHLIHDAVLAGGKPTRYFADLLHGTWLGHPLHPLLTDLVVGSWSAAAIFDLLSLFSDGDEMAQTADNLTAVGALAAVPTVLSGLMDYSTAPHNTRSTVLVHALANDIGFVTDLLSLKARRDGNRGAGLALSGFGFGLLAAGAYLGGHLVFNEKVGVRHLQPVDEPGDWQPVLASEELTEATPRRVEVAEQPVLVYRQNGTIFAVGARCPHAGGPLDEGAFENETVQCPWHDSVFALSNGAVVHGPATNAVPNYEVRERDGQVELRFVSSPA